VKNRPVRRRSAEPLPVLRRHAHGRSPLLLAPAFPRRLPSIHRASLRPLLPTADVDTSTRVTHGAFSCAVLTDKSARGTREGPAEPASGVTVPDTSVATSRGTRSRVNLPDPSRTWSDRSSLQPRVGRAFRTSRCIRCVRFLHGT
jgi:hypothetical protein